MASVLGFIGGPQERRKEQRSQKKQTMAVQGRRYRHPGVGTIRGATLLLLEAGVHSLTCTCFLTCGVGTAGVTSPSGSPDGAQALSATHFPPAVCLSNSLPVCPAPSTPFVLRCISYIPALTQRTLLAPSSLSATPKMLFSSAAPTQDSLSAARAPFIPRSLYKPKRFYRKRSVDLSASNLMSWGTEI